MIVVCFGCGGGGVGGGGSGAKSHFILRNLKFKFSTLTLESGALLIQLGAKTKKGPV